MSSLIDTITDWETQLNAAGIRATCDPRSLNPPCVLLIPPTFAADVADGGTGVFTAYVITPGPGNLDAYKALDTMTSAVADVIPVLTIEPGSYAVDATVPLPAFVLTWTEALTWP